LLCFFHHPAVAFSGEREAVQSIARTMVMMSIDPEEIYIMPSATLPGVQLIGSLSRDIENIKFFLRKHLNFATATQARDSLRARLFVLTP
jgi:hypothetical protein